MPESYFHCASTHIEVGSVIKPGNWGRIIKKYGKGSGSSWEILYREMCLEYIRKLEFPTKPSRMHGLFLCRTLDEMNFFIQSSNRQLDIIYKVELVNPEYPIHYANWSQVSPQNWTQQDSIIGSMEDCARRYWEASQDHGQFTECLTESAAQIIDII